MHACGRCVVALALVVASHSWTARAQPKPGESEGEPKADTDTAAETPDQAEEPKAATDTDSQEAQGDNRGERERTKESSPASTESSLPPSVRVRPVFQAPDAAQPAVLAQKDEPEPGPTDHEQVIGRLGLGWLGMSEVPIAVAEPSGTQANPALVPNHEVRGRLVEAPVLGVRYWFNEWIAIEPGIGFRYDTGSIESDMGYVSAKVDKQPTKAVLGHLGAPIALATGQHMTLLLVPEVQLGLAWSKASAPYEQDAPPDADLRGLRFDVGARAGTEIHFGFMGLEQLALEASVGVFYSMRKVSASVGNQRLMDTSVVISTTSFSQPWDIFLNQVAARYYF